ncbi:MAG: hypothetical protein HN353_13585 [Bdellovibrionales bacterium]|jgi:hypothetical protein|nr:hypothetical protein [Bdellovibrionales bacterium]MBT3524875.1 hypothetical protein [Bdellovibrionales bacterium]MBT7767509.1 hypothetical protein [Bdellovibrionales bacterium]
MGAPHYKSAPKIFAANKCPTGQDKANSKQDQATKNKQDKAEIARLKNLIQDKLKSKSEIKKAAVILTLLLQADQEKRKDRD